MTRPRKAEVVPESVSPPSPEAALEKRTRYLLQEIGAEAGFLEQWIVHYLAELLETSEDTDLALEARSEARAEIARVLPALWEQQIAREAVTVRAKVDYLLRRTDAVNPEAEDLVRPLLAEPGSVGDLSKTELGDGFRALRAVEDLILRLWVTVAGAERSKHEVTPEAVDRFLERDEEVQGLLTALARLIPDFATLDPSDYAAVEAVVHQALLAASQAQQTLLSALDEGKGSKSAG
jgi:hypothetical protein